MKGGDRVEVRPGREYANCPLIGTIVQITPASGGDLFSTRYVVELNNEHKSKLNTYPPHVRLLDAVTQLGDVARG